MVRGFWGLLLFAALASASYAQEAVPAAEFTWPSSRVPVVIKNREVNCSWRDGKPWARFADIAPLLSLPPSDGADVDVAQALAQKGYVIFMRGGTVEAKPGKATSGELTWVPADQFTWPTAMVKVVVKNRDVQANWRDGRPVADRSIVTPILNLPPGEGPVDLVQVLTEMKYVVAQKPDGSLEVRATAPPAGGSAYVPSARPGSSEPRWVFVSEAASTAAGETPSRFYLDTTSIQGNKQSLMFTYRSDDAGEVDVSADLQRSEYRTRIHGYQGFSDPKPIPPGSMVDGVIAAALKRVRK